MSVGREELAGLSAMIVAAYVAHNNLPRADLAHLISSTHAALQGLGKEPERLPEPQLPAVSIRKSVTPNAIFCLEDGKAFKSLKRHLTMLGMTPDEYRQKWGLPSDYPMVAPNYSEARAALARSIGLGRKVGKAPINSNRKRATR